jgi:hypothetical protein
MPKPNIQAEGFLVGRETLTNFEFNPGFPYTYCRLCGEVYQGVLDRRVPAGHLPENSLIAKLAYDARMEWTFKHAHTHPEKEHNALRASNRAMTPEAANRLAAYGVFSVTDMVTDAEVSEALKEAPRTPTNDATGET